ncbi:MAG: sulfatase-like hydrolase/transferase [Promethearchaeota archaeon]
MLLKSNETHNIVFITIDALRYDTTHSLIKNNRLPNIRRLAKRSIFFENAISVAPGTPLSVQSFLTSTYPFMYDGCLNFSPRKSFVELLRRENFSTVSCQTNAFISKFFGFDRGFSSFFDGSEATNASRKRKRSPFAIFNINKFFFEKRRDAKSLRLGTFLMFLSRFLYTYMNAFLTPFLSAEQLTGRFLKLIKENDRRFFAWIHYMDAHQPHHPYRPDLFTSFKFGRIESKLGGRKSLSRDEILWLSSWYKDSVLYVDRFIGFLLSKLEEIGITLDNTYFILTSDHGQEFLEHGMFGHGQLYDETIHVPLIIAGPELSPCVLSQQISQIDLAPTVLGLSGFHKNIPGSYLGRDLSQSLKESRPQIVENPAISEVGILVEKLMGARTRILKLDQGYCKVSYRFKNRKYIYSDMHNEDVSDELYDLTKDPNERYNLIEEETYLAREFLEKIKQHIRMEMKTKGRQREHLKILSLSKTLSGI